MIGLLIITHERIGEAYRALAHHVFGSQMPENVQILGVNSDENQEDIINRAIGRIQDFPENHGVLIMTDIFGATPCNAARRMVRAGKSAMLTGLNAPMMVKAVQYAPEAADLAAFTEKVKQAGVNGIFAITAEPDDLACRQPAV